MEANRQRTMREIWGATALRLMQERPGLEYVVTRLKPVSYQLGRLTLAADGDDVRWYAEHRCVRLFRRELRLETGRDIDLEFIEEQC